MTFAPGSPSSRPTSSVTCSKTRLGGASPATSVATLRSAACSPASARCAASVSASARAARVRSAVTAASSSDVTAEVAMKSCVASRLSVSELAHERPGVLRGLPDGDRAHDEDRRRRAARPEAQRRPQQRGEHDVGNVALRPAARRAPAGRRAATPPSTRFRRRMPRTPAAAHVSIAGATTSTPAASPASRCGTRRRARPVVITPPRRSAIGPKAALMTAATSAQR